MLLALPGQENANALPTVENCKYPVLGMGAESDSNAGQSDCLVILAWLDSSANGHYSKRFTKKFQRIPAGNVKWNSKREFGSNGSYNALLYTEGKDTITCSSF